MSLEDVKLLDSYFEEEINLLSELQLTLYLEYNLIVLY
jgi:hypothetical protein